MAGHASAEGRRLPIGRGAGLGVHAWPVDDASCAPCASELPVLRLIPSQASIYDWQVLPGVGPVLAGRLHNALYGLACVDEAMLDDVPGVGPVRLDQWSDLLVLGVQS